MNVCFVSFEFPPKILGGAGTYADLLVKGLSRLGVDVFVLASGEDDTIEENICRLRVSEKAYLRQFLFMSRASKTLGSLGKKHGFDLIHYNEPHLLRKRFLGLPAISTFHSSQFNEIRTMLKFAGSTLTTTGGLLDFTVRSPIGYIGDIITGQTSDAVISPSENLANLLASQCFIVREKMHVIPNAVDFEKLDKVKADDEILKRHNLVDEQYILFLGRISAMKGLDYLVEAFKTIKAKNATRGARNLKLVIAGSGAYEGSLRQKAKGVKGIVFTGFIDTLEKRKALYSNSLAVVLPSLYEALPMVVLEAMAMYKPVIATRVGDIPTVIEDGMNGLLMATKDAKGLGQGIEVLCSDPQLAREMGLKGRSIVEKNFTVELMSARTLDVYRGLIEQGDRRLKTD